MDIKDLNFPSWLALYQWVEKNNLHTDDRIKLVYQHDHPAVINGDNVDLASVEREVVLHLETIRANAFLEIYKTLPQENTLTVLNGLLNDLTHIVGKKKTQPLLEFLNKQPTRP